MIEIWENKLTESPSVQVGRITIDFGKKETEAQARLFSLVMNHPDTRHTDKFRGPVTDEIGDAFVAVLQEEVKRHRLRIKHEVKFEVSRLTNPKS